MKKLIINILYDVAGACCHVADWLSPTADDIWRERQWRKWGGDRARLHDGPPILSWSAQDEDDDMTPLYPNCLRERQCD